ncbi:MAG TPA: hypothetical protein VNT23_05905, partial [Gaiellaceae bacterium]|nr:hypothetical protein [Gaiellaceae bacterium]
MLGPDPSWYLVVSGILFSIESSTISGLRRSITPNAPIEKRIPETTRYQLGSGPSIGAPAVEGLRRARLVELLL